MKKYFRSPRDTLNSRLHLDVLIWSTTAAARSRLFSHLYSLGMHNACSIPIRLRHFLLFLGWPKSSDFETSSIRFYTSGEAVSVNSVHRRDMTLKLSAVRF